MNGPAPPDGPVVEDAPDRPRSDLVDALGWLLLGVAVLARSLLMDRLQNQDVPPFAVPGLLPGLLGVALILLGGLLLLRSLGRDAPSDTNRSVPPSAASGRTAIAIAICVLFGAVLVGHGLPFWAASAVFVTASILLLRRGPGGERAPLDVKAVAVSALIGLSAGGAITLLFQQIFLVRLP